MGTISRSFKIQFVAFIVSTSIILTWFSYSITKQHHSTWLTTPEQHAVHIGYESYPKNESLRIHCRTCAFVTGSGHMNGSNQGERIDSYDCVIRSNDSPTKGFESDVGKRTTIRTVDAKSFTFVSNKLAKDPSLMWSDDQKQGVFMLYGFPDERQVVRRHAAIDEAKESLNNLTVHIMGKAKFNEHYQLYNEYVEDLSKIKTSTISNGFTSIYFAHDICEEIRVFGIAYPNYCQEHKDSNVTYHYYPKSSKSLECAIILTDDKVTGRHHFTKEKLAFQSLAKIWKNLLFHSPEWPESDYLESTLNRKP